MGFSRLKVASIISDGDYIILPRVVYVDLPHLLIQTSTTILMMHIAIGFACTIRDMCLLHGRIPEGKILIMNQNKYHFI